MNTKNLTVKTILAVFIVVIGMLGLMFLNLSDTVQNSIVNIMIMVVSYHFGSSAGSSAKDKLLREGQSIGGSQVPVSKDEK